MAGLRQKVGILSAYLVALFLVHTILMQLSQAEWVMCIGNDGHVAVEVYKSFPFPSETAENQRFLPSAPEGYDHAQGCVDIVIESDAFKQNGVAKRLVQSIFQNNRELALAQNAPRPVALASPFIHLSQEPRNILRSAVLLI